MSEALRLANLVDHGADSTQIEREVATELRRLHAENEALRPDAERYRWLRDFHGPSKDHASYEALRADAERYRWLRENSTNYSLTQKDGYGGRELKGWGELDAAIDAAMGNV